MRKEKNLLLITVAFLFCLVVGKCIFGFVSHRFFEAIYRGEHAVELYYAIERNGFLQDSIVFPYAGVYELDIVASGDLTGKEYPRMEVLIDRATQGIVDVDSERWKHYQFSISVPRGTHYLAIGLINNYSEAGKNLNLNVKKIILNQKSENSRGEYTSVIRAVDMAVKPFGIVIAERGQRSDQSDSSSDTFWSTLTEHVRVIWPTLLIVCCAGCAIRFWGCHKITGFLLILLIFSVLTLIVVIFFLSPLQFFVILLPAMSSYFFSSALLYKANLIDKINVAFLLLCCQVVIIVQGLSLINKINASGFIVMAAIFFVLSCFFVKDIKKVICFDYENLKYSYRKLCLSIQSNKLVSVFLCAVLFSLLWRFFVILYFPPNHFDSMHYHLSRVAYWLQHQSLKHYYVFNYRQIIFPYNTEIMFLWTMIATKLDFLCGFVQFLCYLLSGTLIFKSLRVYLKVSLLASLTIMLVWYSLPINVVESTSTKNNLVVAYFIMLSLYFLIIRVPRDVKSLLISGVALGVAIGTKVTILIFIIPFFVMLLYFLVRGVFTVSRFLLWSGISLTSFFIFGSYCYIQNYIHFQNFFGPEKFMQYAKVTNPSMKTFFCILFQHLYNLITNLTGIQFYASVTADHYNNFVAKIGSEIFRFFHIPTNVPDAMFHDLNPMFFSGSLFYFDSWINKFKIYEEYPLFGFIGPLLITLVFYVFFATLINLIVKRKNCSLPSGIFAYLFLGCLFTTSMIKLWDPWAGGHMIIVFLVGFPVMSLVYTSQTKFMQLLQFVIILCSILSLIPSTFMNQSKPLKAYKLSDGDLSFKPNVTGGWMSLAHNKDRLGLRMLIHPNQEGFYRLFESVVPLQSRVGLVLGFDQWDYPLFGEKLQRTLVPVNAKIVREQEFDYVLVSAKMINRKPELQNLISRYYGNPFSMGWSFSGGMMTLYHKNKDFLQGIH